MRSNRHNDRVDNVICDESISIRALDGVAYHQLLQLNSNSSNMLLRKAFQQPSVYDNLIQTSGPHPVSTTVRFAEEGVLQ
jgi:hypothetical protein